MAHLREVCIDKGGGDGIGVPWEMSRGGVSEAVRPVWRLERNMVRLAAGFARVGRHPMGVSAMLQGDRH